MRVVLINPPALLARLNYSAFTHPPLGLACLAACLRQQGHEVSVIDAVGEAVNRFSSYSGSRKFLIQGLTPDDIVSRLPPDSRLIGVSCMFTHTWPLVRVLIREIRRVFPGVPLIAGGEHPTAMFGLCLRQAPLDACVLGEGENTIVDLARAIENNRPLSEIAGLAWKDPATGDIRRTMKRSPITDLDALPRPAWDLIPWKAYRLYVGPKSGRTIPMMGSRGCAYRCSFCSAPTMWGGRWRKRTPENIVREMAGYVEADQVTEFQFSDISPLINRPWIQDLCRAIIKELPGIRWQMPVGGRSEIMDADLAELLVRSGCRYIQFAPESGSPAVLAAMNKHLDLNRFRNAVLAAKKAGMIVSVLFIIGYPSETIKDIRLTWRLIRWLAINDVAEIAISSFALLPGSAVFDELCADRALAIDDTFLYQAADATALMPTTSWNPVMGRRALLLLKWVGLFQFYAMAFLRHPSRIARLVFNLAHGRQETKIDRVLMELVEKFRNRFLRKKG